jgi:acetyl-CoA synthetase
MSAPNSNVNSKSKIPVSTQFQSSALTKPQDFVTQTDEAATKNESYWAKQAERIEWIKKWDKVKEVSFKKPVSIKWYLGGKLNISVNCLDRHLKTQPNKTAIIWEADQPDTPSRKISYKELHAEVNRWGNMLRSQGVKKGDVVTIYMPMIPEAAMAMLACTRIGAIHSVVFGGFSPDAIADRVIDGASSWIITADEGLRGGKAIPLKNNVEQAIHKLEKLNAQTIKKCFVYSHTNRPHVMQHPSRDININTELKKHSDWCEPEVMDSEDPMFLLYTSGSTNKPKGVLHTTGGYLVYASYTHEKVFDLKPNDIYWCTADVGWITGHSYIVYGPLANGSTTVMFEGIPNYPTCSRFWQVIDKHQVSIFYTAPTALRALMRESEDFVKNTSRKSLRLLGSVGEPINPEAWLWYYKVVGDERCPIVDTWWQTETGGILISPLPGAFDLKPGSATKPLPGIFPELLTPEGKKIDGAGEGVLALKDSWPGQMRTVYRDHARFEETYFSTYPGYYFTGDGCRRDEDGYYWITGRVDDVLNVSGHRLGTAEIESALVAHHSVAEAATVGYPHDIKGQGIYVYVTLKQGITPTEELKKELIKWVAQEISPIAKPDLLQWAPALPKTRSGKIMRRILRKIAENQIDSLGDTSTLADPSVVQDLIKNRVNQ